MLRVHALYGCVAVLTLCSACGPEGTARAPSTDPVTIPTDDASDADAGVSTQGSPPASDSGAGTPTTMPVAPGTVGDTFTLVPDWNGPCSRATVVDVNLGTSPESFVRAAYCQINGSEPPAATVTNWANQLRTVGYVRRIDVVRTLCNEANRTCALVYSNPWQTKTLSTTHCVRKTTRDVGAVMMFFFNCPGGLNCTMDWANTHAWGMNGQDVTYGFGSATTGYYSPGNKGFWLRELLDARYAGLQFVMPNVYGYDTGLLPNLEDALTALDGMGGGMQVGLFNDTWAWGKPAGGAAQNPAPNLSNTEDAAQRIYAVQWKPFFTAISKPHWYTVNGAPLIYFYNAGTLMPASGTSAVIARLKQLFMADFGITPFVDVDMGFGPTSSADAQFVWDTFATFPKTGSYLASTTTATGHLTFGSAMVKWDSLGRDSPGAIATAATRMFKGTDILQTVLANSANANLLLLATWNDLGEGTGITRNYDYYYQGQWLEPDAFMNIIRSAQCSN